MSPSELEEIVYADPFRPFRVTLSSGDEFIIHNRHRAMISGLSLILGLNDDPAARTGTRLKIVSIPTIAIAEQVDASPPGSSRRRRT